ncbi:MAG: hypothetical protein K6A43_03955 [Treponema sp.]|nr:hypothetical protein [Treponema sp.]
MKQEKVAGRVFYIFAFIFLVIATWAGFYYHGDIHSIVPYSHVVIPTIHIISCLFAFVCIIKPIYPFNFIVCLIESSLTILTGDEILGVFLFYAGIIIFCLHGEVSTKKKITISIFFAFHCLTILLSYTHGWMKTMITFGSSLFMAAFFLWIYSILKERLSCFLPSKVTHNTTVGFKQPGSELKLSDYGLTERQINLVLDYIYNNISYKELGEKYALSHSLVKKEFNEVFQIFNVSKIEELYILLLQYQLKR